MIFLTSAVYIEIIYKWSLNIMGRKGKGTRSTFRGGAIRLDQEPTGRTYSQRDGSYLTPNQVGQNAIVELRKGNRPRNERLVAEEIVGLWRAHNTPLVASEFWRGLGNERTFGFYKTYTRGSGVIAFCATVDFHGDLTRRAVEPGIFSPERHAASELVAATLADIVGGDAALTEFDQRRLEQLQAQRSYDMFGEQSIGLRFGRY